MAATGNLESAWPMADLSLAELDFINRQLSWGTRLIPGLRLEQEPLSSAPIQDFGSAELTHAVLAGYGAEQTGQIVTVAEAFPFASLQD